MSADARESRYIRCLALGTGWFFFRSGPTYEVMMSSGEARQVDSGRAQSALGMTSETPPIFWQELAFLVEESYRQGHADTWFEYPSLANYTIEQIRDFHGRSDPGEQT